MTKAKSKEDAMELLQLRYFKEAAETENFSEVAKNHYVPQPSISKTIKKLEQELGVSLFDRSGKKVKLNSNGKIFYDKISIALDNIDFATQYFSSPVKKNIIVYPQAGSRFVSLLIADFLSNNQNAFITNVNQSYIDSGNLYDFTFMQPLDDMSAYEYELLMRDQIVLVTSKEHPLSGKSEVSVKELRDYDFIGYYKTIALRQTMDELCEEYGGFSPNVIFETHEYTALRYLVEKNRGITLLPKTFLSLQHTDMLSVIPLKEKKYRDLLIAWKKGRILSENEKTFLNFTREWFIKNTGVQS